MPNPATKQIIALGMLIIKLLLFSSWAKVQFLFFFFHGKYFTKCSTCMYVCLFVCCNPNCFELCTLDSQCQAFSCTPELLMICWYVYQCMRALLLYKNTGYTRSMEYVYEALVRSLQFFELSSLLFSAAYTRGLMIFDLTILPTDLDCLFGHHCFCALL